MWSDEIHKKMEEAGDSHHPAYDEKSWEKMESLLDKHLPEKKKKRRFIFFLLPLVLTGAGIFFFTRQQQPNMPLGEHKSTSTPALPVQNDNKSYETRESLSNTINQNRTNGIDVVNPDNESNKSPVAEASPGTEQKTKTMKAGLAESPDKATAFNRRNLTTLPNSSSAEIESTSIKNSIKEGRKRKTTKASDPSASTPSQNETLFTQQNPAASLPITAQGAIEKKDTSAVANSTTQDSLAKEENETPGKNIPSKSSRGSKISLNVAFGPDLSSVSFRQPGKLQLQYGIGVGYQLTKQLSIRTGFFAARKVYEADSTTYKTPYPIHNLEEIEANCLVYEIPLLLQYHFGARNNHEWFVSGGVSSYLMKKETYGYHYKNAWGTPQYYKRTYRNENKHLFSVIHISGGYTYKLSDRLSISGEPYVKIPAAGVGVGKVKLTSAGVLFTVGFKPFLRSK